MINSLSKKELCWLNQTIKITMEISKCYQNLTKLELKDEKNTSEYKEKVANLRGLLEKENNHYENSLLTNKNYDSILQSFTQKDENIPKRIIDKLSIELTEYKNEEKIAKALSKENIEIFSFLGYNNLNQIKKIISKNLYLNANLSKILLEEQKLLSLYYLEQTPNIDNNEIIRNYIIRTKYKACEEELLDLKLLNNNFKLSKPDLLTTKELSNLLETPEIEIKITMEEILEKEINKILSSLIEISDCNYEDKEFYLVALQLRNVLRATLELTENLFFKEIYNKIFKYLNGNKYKEKYTNHNISKGIIISEIKTRKNNCQDKIISKCIPCQRTRELN